MLGYALVKKEDLEVALEIAERIIEHTASNAGFTNENGNFETDGFNKTIQKNWSLFRILQTNFNRAKRRLL